MKQFVGVALVLGIFSASVWAKDCTYSKEFQLSRPQVLAGTLEDPAELPLPGFTLELISDGNIKATTTTNGKGEYSLGEIPTGSYRIHIRLSDKVFCAPKVICDQAGCSIQPQVEFNPKIKPVVVY